jgi:hypothetical protein
MKAPRPQASPDAPTLPHTGAGRRSWVETSRTTEHFKTRTVHRRLRDFCGEGFSERDIADILAV